MNAAKSDGATAVRMWLPSHPDVHFLLRRHSWGRGPQSFHVLDGPLIMMLSLNPYIKIPRVLKELNLKSHGYSISSIKNYIKNFF